MRSPYFRHSSAPWGLVLAGLALFAAGCTVASSTTGRKYKKFGHATFCPSPSLPSCPDADREEHDVENGVYYCYFDCALHEGEPGNWKVTFIRAWDQNLQEFCWYYVETTKVGDC